MVELKMKMVEEVNLQLGAIWFQEKEFKMGAIKRRFKIEVVLH